MVKKANAALSLLLCGVLLLHMVLTGLLMAGIVGLHLWFRALAHTLLLILVIHLLLTFIPMSLNHDGNVKRPYARLNLRCYLQRLASIGIIAFLHPHLKAFVKPDTLKHVVIASQFHFIALVVFVLFCCLHIAISIPKALVGLGIIIEEKPLACVEKICFVCVFAVGALAIFGASSLAAISGLFGGGL